MTKITLLDGGMGQELVHRSGDAPTPLWATQVMLDHPGLVANIHRDYFDAGATIATTNTYAIHRDRLAGTGFENKFEDFITAALSEAEQSAAGRGRIAGSIGPLVASYRPEAHPAVEDAVPLYHEIVGLLAPSVDLILFETVASLTHAQSCLTAAQLVGVPVWLSVTVDDEDGSLLRSGENVSDLCAIAGSADALLANCSAPEAMEAALTALKTCGKPFGAYANGFTQITKDFLKDKPTVDALHSRDISPQAYADFALRWVEIGATIVGGCCEVGPPHIAELARALTAAGHDIV